MADNGEVKKLVTYPLNLQSFLQTMLLICSLAGILMYAERRMTQMEMKSQRADEVLQEQRELLKQLNDGQQRSLGNQEIMLKQLYDNRRK
jgi:hypothetical protein